MKIALWGYGRMGREVEQAATQRGHHVSGVIEAETPESEKLQILDASDVVVEFTRPDALIQNLRSCLHAGIAMVSGTTGWYAQLPQVKQEVEKAGGSFLYASNFSPGANLFFALNKMLARLMKTHIGSEDYRLLLEEVHHIHKLDAPSGTAITLKNDIMQETGLGEPGFSLQGDDPVYSEDLFALSAIRKDAVTGIHRVEYKSLHDAIRIEHEAFSRKGFALGAVLAAEWLPGKKGIFTMQDVLQT
jgi:4-hydroxy-tetrahydrodipicolinate reductase